MLRGLTEPSMDVLFAYVLIATVTVVLFGCIYAAWALVSDLAAGWSEVVRRGRFPRQFGIGVLFSITTVVAITCFLLQGVPIEGVAQAVVMFSISLAWAAAIVFALQCMIGEWRRPRSADAEHHLPGSDPPALFEEDVTRSPANDDPPVELSCWLSAQSGAADDGEPARPASTAAMRSHFRVHLSEGPKGVKFGRV